MAHTDCWDSPLVYRVRAAMLTVLCMAGATRASGKPIAVPETPDRDSVLQVRETSSPENGFFRVNISNSWESLFLHF